MSELKPPIILFGNVRSGTTMMHDLFDLHPEVVSWFEPRTVWTYADPRRPHDRFDASDATPRVRNFVRKRFLQYQRRHGNRRVMEKTPSNVMRVPYVHAIFPEARFIYILREPLANLSSAERRWERTGALNRRVTLKRLRETAKTQLPWYLSRYLRDHWRVKVLRKRTSSYGVRYPGFGEELKRLSTPELIAHQWVACSEQMDADLAQIDADLAIRFRYEDFVRAPVEHFTRVLDHVGLEMTSEIEQRLRDWVDPGRQDKWRCVEPAVLQQVMPILRDEMMKQGYKIPAEVVDPRA